MCGALVLDPGKPAAMEEIASEDASDFEDMVIICI